MGAAPCAGGGHKTVGDAHCRRPSAANDRTLGSGRPALPIHVHSTLTFPLDAGQAIVVSTGIESPLCVQRGCARDQHQAADKGLLASRWRAACGRGCAQLAGMRAEAAPLWEVTAAATSPAEPELDLQGQARSSPRP